jgi:(p)ppGpp synthase/HD superfamily hydrolase
MQARDAAGRIGARSLFFLGARPLERRLHVHDGDVTHRLTLRRTLAGLRQLSQELGPHVRLLGRIKSAVSIADKMSIHRLDAHRVLDVIGARVVTERTRDCYRLIHRIHRSFHVLADE